MDDFSEGVKGFQNLTKNFKIKFPGNQGIIFISPESAQSTDAFWVFSSEKFPCKKKLLGVPYPGVQPSYEVHILSMIGILKTFQY